MKQSCWTYTSCTGLPLYILLFPPLKLSNLSFTYCPYLLKPSLPISLLSCLICPISSPTQLLFTHSSQLHFVLYSDSVRKWTAETKWWKTSSFAASFICSENLFLLIQNSIFLLQPQNDSPTHPPPFY